MFSYRQSYDKAISDSLKKMFSKDVQILEQAGFRFFSLHQEVIWPFSVIFLFPVYLMMAKGEIVRVETPLRITSYHLMYVSEDGGTFAYIYGLGTKFYTKFADGTWLVSNTMQNFRDQKVVVQKREEDAAGTEQVWGKHYMKLQEYQLKGLQPAPRVSFQDWVEIEGLFDQNNVRSVLSLGIVWMIFLIWAIYWVVVNGRSFLERVF